jgi:hypothetical protein
MSILEVIEEVEKAPEGIEYLEGFETPERVVLQELSVGTIIQFYGHHPDSRYTCLIVGAEDSKQIKVWLNSRCNGAVGDLDSMLSIDLSKGIREEGAMEVGKNYSLPTFKYDKDHNLTLEQGYNQRTEPYLKIFVLKPGN